MFNARRKPLDPADNIQWSDMTKLNQLGRKIGKMFAANNNDYPDPFDSSEFKEAQYMYALCLYDEDRLTVVIELHEGIRQHYHMAQWEIELLLPPRNDIIA